MRLGQEGTARQYDVVGARVLAEVLLARPTRGGMASVSIRADSADWDKHTIRFWATRPRYPCLATTAAMA